MGDIRARTDEEKAAKFSNIINIARDMIVNQSEKGFSTRQLAKKVGMKQSSLYRYISSKRDLWFAIACHDLDILVEKFENAINKHEGNYIELLYLFCDVFFDFALEDYNRILFLFRTRPWNSDSVGPFEQNYKPVAYFDPLARVFQQCIDNGELEIENPRLLMYHYFSTISGAILTLRFPSFDQEPNEFKNFVKNQIKMQLDRYKP